jgi:hypothetical protein
LHHYRRNGVHATSEPTSHQSTTPEAYPKVLLSVCNDQQFSEISGQSVNFQKTQTFTETSDSVDTSVMIGSSETDSLVVSNVLLTSGDESMIIGDAIGSCFNGICFGCFSKTTA